MFKLRNQIKHYEWGSPEWIPRLLGAVTPGGMLEDPRSGAVGKGGPHNTPLFAGKCPETGPPFKSIEFKPPNTAAPCAELWMGSHSGAPSRVITERGEINLDELIAEDPACYLGKNVAEQYGGLPFLFKLLAAERPLSIQAHPNLAQAREGFERENRTGLAADAPNRNYRDANHKPEIICAITPFSGMCGFRPPDETRRLLEAFLSPPSGAAASLQKSFAPLLAAFDSDNADNAALRNFLKALFSLSAQVKEELTAYILDSTDDGIAADSIISFDQWKYMRCFAELYPGDPALIAPLYLNLFSLEPGEAVFLRAGILHAYIHGFGVELMASSDNVLRGGLTSKHIDLPELMGVLDFSPFKPDILRPSQPAPPRFVYPSPCREFSLSVMHGAGTEAAAFTETGPAICIVTEGEAAFSSEQGGQGEMILKKGESVFIPAGECAQSPPLLRGKYTLYTASVPLE